MESELLHPQPRIPSYVNIQGQTTTQHTHILNPTFADPTNENILQRNKVSNCLPRGHLFGAVFERESIFSFYFGGLLTIAFLLTLIYCFINYEPDSQEELKPWRYLFYIKACFQLCKLFNYSLMRCFKVQCNQEIVHYLILSCIHLFYSWAFTEKREEVKYIAYFAFAYVILINFIGITNINKMEATISEIVFFGVLMKVSNDQNWGGETNLHPNKSREQSWYLAFLVLFILAISASIIIIILLITIKYSLKVFITLIIFLGNSISVIVCILFLDDFALEGKNNKMILYVVISSPILSLISYIMIKNKIKDKFDNTAYRTVLKMYLLGEIDSVVGYIRRRELNRRRAEINGNISR